MPPKGSSSSKKRGGEDGNDHQQPKAAKKPSKRLCTCGFCAKTSKEVAWGSYDEDGLPVFDICWACSDICQRIAPDKTTDKCLELYNGPEQDGGGFKTDFDKSSEIIDEDDEGGFRPGAHAHHSKCWSYDVFQDHALLTETEFTRICKQTPQQAKKKPLSISFSGMNSNEKYYPVAMKGMSLEDMLSCRKIRLKMSDTATLSEVYVTPQDQLLAQQGQTMLAHILKKQGTPYTAAVAKADKDNSSKPLLSAPAPKSVQDYLKEHSQSQTAEERKNQEAALHLAREAERRQNADALDDLMQDLQDEEESEDGPKIKRRRQPGFTASSLTGQASAPKAKASSIQKKTSAAAPTTPSTTVPPASEPVGEDDVSSRGGTKWSLDKDKDMKMVADKHLSESAKGSSAKALVGLVPATFLVISEKRYMQSAKLRGARSILESLKQNDHSNAASVLQDRIAACESCEVFASKNIKTIEEPNFQALVQQVLTQGAITFPFEVQFKLAERYTLIHKARPCRLAWGKDKDIEEAVKDLKQVNLGMAGFARALCPDPIDESECKFDILKPTFWLVLHGMAKKWGVIQTTTIANQGLAEVDTDRLMQDVLGETGSGQIVPLGKAKPMASGDDECDPALHGTMLAVSKDIGTTMVELLNEDGFLDLIRYVPHTREPLLMFCSTFLDRVSNLQDNPSDKKLFDHPLGEPIKHGLDRITSICRACCHFFCAEVSVGMEETTDKDVIDFVQSACTEMPERSIKKIFAEKESWWNKEYEDMIKKGATSVLTTEKRQELQQLLQEPTPSVAGMKRSIELMKEMHNTMRSQRLASLRDKFKASIFAFAHRVMTKEEGITLTNELVGKIYEGLEIIKDLPGVSDFTKQMNTFASQQSHSMALNDLLKITGSSGADTEVDIIGAAKAMAAVTKGGVDLAQHVDFQEVIDSLLSRCVRQLFLKASELEPDGTIIQRHVNFITLLAAKRSDLAGGGDGSSVLMRKMVALFIDVVTYGQNLVNTNRKCVAVATGDIDAHLASEGLKLLKTVLTLRKEVVKHSSKITQVAQEIRKSGFAVSADLGDLLDWKLPAQFETELVSEAFDDIAAKKCSQLIESLMERMGSLQSALQRHVKDSEDDTDYFTLFSAPGTSWKSELTESCSPEEILQAAKGSVLAKLPIKELKEFSSSIEKDKVSTDQFIIDYAEAVGPVASELFGKLSKAVEVALEKAKIAKIYVVELLLTKSIVNYRSCYKLGDETGVIEARGVIKQQMDLFAGDGSGNQLGLRASDIFEPLLNAEKHTHG